MALFSANVTGESLAAAAVETVIQIVASANKRINLVRWGISFNGVSVTDQPVRVELIRLTSAGTSSAFVPLKLDPTGDAAMASARTSHTAEPAPSDVLEVHYVTPAGGNLIEVYAPDERPVIAANGRLGIRVLATNAVNTNAFMIFEE